MPIAATPPSLPAFDESHDPEHEAEEEAAAARGEEQIVVIAPPTCPDPDAPPTPSSSSEGEGKVTLEQHHYAKLRFFDTCASFLKYKKGKQWMGELEPYTGEF